MHQDKKGKRKRRLIGHRVLKWKGKYSDMRPHVHWFGKLLKSSKIVKKKRREKSKNLPFYVFDYIT